MTERNHEALAADGPLVVERGAQPYVAIRRTVTMQSIPEIADRIPEVFGWLAEHGVEAAGPPFLKYDVIDMDRALVMEAGVPVRAAVSAGDPVFCATLPAGRYVTSTYHGHFDGLLQATGQLLDWAAEQGLRWDCRETDQGEAWGCRLEVYWTDPREQPDPSGWVTELVFRLAD